MSADPHTLYIAVDPGKKGAIAARFPDGTIEVKNYTTTTDMAQAIRQWEAISFMEHSCGKTVATLESVHSSPQAGPKQSFSFGQNFGEWLGIFAALGIQLNLAKPQEWQRMIPGRSGKSGSDLKNVLKAHAQRQFPDLKVTLTNADALLILHYAIQ